jgi:cytochrome P450
MTNSRVITGNLDSIRQALQRPQLCPHISELESFGGRVKGLPILPLLPFEDHRRARSVLNTKFNARALGQWREGIQDEVAIALKQMTGPQTSLRTSFALPLASRASARLVGLQDTAFADEALAYAADVRSFTSVRRSRRVGAALRLGRLLARIIQSPDCPQQSPALLYSLREQLPMDVLVGVTTAVLTIGVELLVRSILVCTWGCSNTTGRDSEDLYTTQLIDYLIASARVVPSAERFVVERTAIAGDVIESGQVLQIELCSGLADPLLQAPGPSRRLADVVLTNGSAPGFVPFGFGQHFCLGAAWTRLVTRIAVSTLFRTYPSLSLEDVNVPIERDVFGGPIDLLVSVE